MTRDLLLSEEKTARRGFLRKLVMAPVVSLATHRLILPAQALVTPVDDAARLQHHLNGFEAAFAELYPNDTLRKWGRCRDGGQDQWRARLVRGDLIGSACIWMDTGPDESLEERLARAERDRVQP